MTYPPRMLNRDQNCKLSIVKPSLRCFRSLPPLSTRQACALAIGNFDGVHRGHQAMLARLHTVAQKYNLIPTVMTFEPHPREYFSGGRHQPTRLPPSDTAQSHPSHTPAYPKHAPQRIFSLRDKLTALASYRIEQVVVERFNAHLAHLSAETFIEQFLVQGLDVRWIIVGADFRFGQKRRGTIALLRAAGQRYHFEVEVLDTITDPQGQRISSSAIRAALAAGELARAESLLGHRYHISGHVIPGRQLGRTLGFPTLNLPVMPSCALRPGIYVVSVHGLGASALPAVASLGTRPTLSEDGQLLLEVHLLDIQREAYGKLVRIEFLQRLRDEVKFPTLSALTAAIANDVHDARTYFAVHGL